MLVGGGELHDRWSSLVGVSAPLSRGIQRFTGITQAMADAAPRTGGGARRSWPRACAGGCSWRTRRASTSACCARRSRARRSSGRPRRCCARSRWRGASRRCSAAGGSRRSPTRSGIEVAVTHRALPDAETCARVFCALFGRLCANAADHRRRGGAARAAPPGRRRRRRGRRRGAARRASAARTSRALPKDPGVYVFRDADGRPLYVGKSVSLRTRARSHFAPRPAATAGPATPSTSTTEATDSELGALLLEDRLISALKPPGNVRLKRQPDGLRLPALPPGHPVPDPRGRARAGRRARRRRRARPRPGGRGRARRAAQLALRPAPLRAHAAAARPPVGLRADGALPVAVPRRPRPEPLPRAPRRGARAVRRRRRRAARCSPTSTRRCAAAAAAQRFERAAWLRRRHERLRALLGRLGGVLRAAHAGARLVLAAHPSDAGRCDAFWIVGGRVVDWGALPTAADELAARTDEALRAAARRRGGLAAGRRGRRGAPRRRLAGRQRRAGARARARARSPARWRRSSRRRASAGRRCRDPGRRRPRSAPTAGRAARGAAPARARPAGSGACPSPRRA